MMKKVWSDVTIEELDVMMTFGGDLGAADEEGLKAGTGYSDPDKFKVGSKALNGIVTSRGKREEWNGATYASAS